jgi:hypothetical protein
MISWLVIAAWFGVRDLLRAERLNAERFVQ